VAGKILEDISGEGIGNIPEDEWLALTMK